jgi:rare lipoprotein A
MCYDLRMATLKRASLGIFCVGAVLATTFFFPDRTDDHRFVRAVIEVHHSALGGAPKPEKDEPEDRTMVASYYGRELEGSPTASGEPFDPDELTAAHKSLPLGTRLIVSRAGESVKVVVNDRGPYVRGRDLDLSLAAAREIGLTNPGGAPVRVKVL